MSETQTTQTGRVGRGRAVHVIIVTAEDRHYVACGTTGSGYQAVRITITNETVTCVKCQREAHA